MDNPKGMRIGYITCNCLDAIFDLMLNRLCRTTELMLKFSFDLKNVRPY